MKKKLPIYTLLKAFGLSDKKIITSLEKDIKILNKSNKITIPQSIITLYDLLFGKEISLVRFQQLRIF